MKSDLAICWGNCMGANSLGEINSFTEEVQDLERST